MKLRTITPRFLFALISIALTKSVAGQNTPISLEIKVSPHDVLNAWEEREDFAEKQRNESWWNRHAWDKTIRDMDEYVSRLKKVQQEGILGEIRFPAIIHSSNLMKENSGFALLRVTLQYDVKPDKESAEKLKYVKGFIVTLKVTDSKKSDSIEIKDILPATKFVDGDYRMTVTNDSRFEKSSNVNVGVNVTGDASASKNSEGERINVKAGGTMGGGISVHKSNITEVSFQWTWQPKNLSVASGVSGNTAWANFAPKGNGEFYIGMIPIELLLRVPADHKYATLKVSSYLRGELTNIDLGDRNIRIEFE